MPIQNTTLPERESAICARLRSVRIDLKWGMPDFAEAIDITRDRLASYEYQRAPVRFWLARRVCERFSIRPTWLATGEGLRNGFGFIHPEQLDRISQNSLFSEVYDTVLRDAPKSSPKLDTVSEMLEDVLGHAPDIAHAAHYVLSSMITRALVRLSPLDQKLFYHDIAVELIGAMRRHRIVDSREDEAAKLAAMELEERIAIWRPFQNSNFTIDKFPKVEDKSCVRLTWKQLKARLTKATEPRGKRAELASAIDVYQSSLNSWLDKDREPGAEAAFRLLEWVTAEEAKQKSSQGALTPGEPKTQLKGSSDETKPKSGRREA